MKIDQSPPLTSLIVDEMDLPVLNLGSGDKALELNEKFSGPRGPVVNVDIKDQPYLESTGREASGAVYSEPPNQKPLYKKADASDPSKLSKLSPTGKFREIHAINPYGFYPHKSYDLLAPAGSMYITGQQKNFYAKDVPHELVEKGKWHSDPSKRIPQKTEPSQPRFSNSEYKNTKLGELWPEHARVDQSITGASQKLDTSKSQTIMITKEKVQRNDALALSKADLSGQPTSDFSREGKA